MSPPTGRREFFALEAGEYLERLALLVGGPSAPDAVDLVRYARALRGAALMAGPPGYAVAAAAIEGVAKAVKDGSQDWNPALSEHLSHTIEECKVLLRKLSGWSDLEVHRCERIAGQLEAQSGAAGGRTPPRATNEDLSAATRAYVAREAAAIAATLEQLAEAVERSPGAESAGPVLQRLQPLRGMGVLPGLSPLPELLEALDQTIPWAARGGAWPPGSGRALRTAAVALSSMARDIAEVGVPQADANEVVRAAEVWRVTFAGDADVVPVGTLFQGGDTDPIVVRGTPRTPAPVPVDTTVELVSLADRLRHAAQVSAGGGSRTARTFSLHTLVIALRGTAMSAAVRHATTEFFTRLERETMAGRYAPQVLRRAADAIAASADSGAVGGLADTLAPLCADLDRPGGAPAPEPPAGAAEPLPEIEIIPIESLAPEPGAVVVSIESLAPDAEPEAVPIESLLLPPYLPFEQTFSTYFQLMTGTGGRPPTAAPVPIQELLYRGRGALERADLVRRELDAALRVRRDLAGIETLLAELLDLVPLALDDRRG